MTHDEVVEALSAERQVRQTAKPATRVAYLRRQMQRLARQAEKARGQQAKDLWAEYFRMERERERILTYEMGIYR